MATAARGKSRMMDGTPLLRMLFVCRGSTADGLGHVMRSRSVALEAARSAAVRMVVIGDDFVDPLLAGRGLHYEVVPDEGELPSYAARFRPNVVFFDALNMTSNVVEQLHQAAMTVSLSPVFNGLADMDLIFHRTVHHGADWDFPAERRPELRCSLDYTVVRDNCVRIEENEYRRNLSSDPLAIVISMGGADAGNKTLRVLEAVRSVPSRLLIWVLLGEGYAHSYQALVDCVQGDRRHEIILAKTSDSMWRVMRTCSLAVLAGGTITYEAVFAGLPSINIFETREHLFLARELVERNVCISAGYPLEEALEVVRANLAHLERSRDELLAMHRNTAGLVDGRGSERIVRETASYYWSRFVKEHPTRNWSSVGGNQGEIVNAQTRVA